MEQFDVVVIGSGPAGEGAAMTAAKNHRSVALIERYYEVGGGCTHWGTIPSKALRHAAKILHDVRRNPLLREFSDASRADVSAAAVDRPSKVIETQVASRHRFYERNRVPICSGEAIVRRRAHARGAAGERQAGAHRGPAHRDRRGLAALPSARGRFHARARLRQRHASCATASIRSRSRSTAPASSAASTHRSSSTSASR